MFAVVYRWKLIPGREAEFEEGWKAGTAAIAREFGGWGSRLHRGEDGWVWAYAQWPDRATWEKAMETRMRHSDVSGCRVPLTSSSARGRRCRVTLLLLVTPAWARLLIRNRPVLRSAALSNAIVIGPGNT
jgi:hypothetical protein